MRNDAEGLAWLLATLEVRAHGAGRALPGLSAIATGLLTGAMLFIGLSVAPWLRSVPLSDFPAWVWSYGPVMRRVMLPMGGLATLVAVATLGFSQGYGAPCRRRLAVGAGCLILKVLRLCADNSGRGAAIAARPATADRDEQGNAGIETGDRPSLA